MQEGRFSFTLVAHSASSAGEWTSLARRAQDLGYEAIALPDHRGRLLSPIPALVAAATATSTLRVTTLVLSAGVRHPALTVEELATLDVLSNGRLTWGIGAGWLPDDYTPLDQDMAPPGARVDALIATVETMRSKFRHAANHPKEALASVQQPHPPLLIGCSQERMIRFAAQVADIVHVSPLPSSRQFGPFTPTIGVEEALDVQRSWITSESLDRSTGPHIALTALPAMVTDDIESAARQIGPLTGLTPDQVRVSPHVLIGSIGQICDTIREREARWGITHWAIPAESIESFAPVIALIDNY